MRGQKLILKSITSSFSLIIIKLSAAQMDQSGFEEIFWYAIRSFEN